MKKSSWGDRGFGGEAIPGKALSYMGHPKGSYYDSLYVRMFVFILKFAIIYRKAVFGVTKTTLMLNQFFLT